jgi:hypothetical protein
MVAGNQGDESKKVLSCLGAPPGLELPGVPWCKESQGPLARPTTGAEQGSADDTLVEQLPIASGPPPPPASRATWVFQEVFSGVGRLSRAFRREGWDVWEPIDAYALGTYKPDHDILDPKVAHRLKARWASKPCYVHFGLPCSSFSILNVNFNSGTRSKTLPLGDGTLTRETQGNQFARAVVSMCRSLLKQGCWFSIENPTSSYLWLCPEIKRLMRSPGVRLVRFDQCAHGLRIQSSAGTGPCKKDTSVLTNAPLEPLAARCPGNHQHIHAKGGVRTRDGWRNLAALAGHYPAPLCRTWAQSCSSTVTIPNTPAHGPRSRASELAGHTVVPLVPSYAGDRLGRFH